MRIQGPTFRGVVVAGRGLGAPSMSQPTLWHALHQLTDLLLVPGTLNVRLSHPFAGTLTGYVTEAELGGHVWRSYAPHRQGIRYGEVLIAGRYRGIIFQGDEPEYPRELVEILSDHHLRVALGLHDGDMVEFTLLSDG